MRAQQTPDFRQRARRVRLLLIDVDGVLTDGKLYYVPGPSGDLVETKGFDSQDGIGLRWAHDAGVQTGLISGRQSPGVVFRAKTLGITYVYQDRLAKLEAFEEIQRQAGLPTEAMAFVGDDLTDLPVMRRVGLAVAVAGARPEVKRQAHYVTRHPGGAGAIREVVELLLKAQGKWQAVLAKYGASPSRRR